MAAKNHYEFCNHQHLMTTGNCHMVVECKECKDIWNAATKAAEEKFTCAEHRKGEIAALANELEDFNSRRVAPYGRITEIVEKMRQLSPVACNTPMATEA